MSLLVWSGTAQFAALSIIGAGGSPALATATGLLSNTRFIPMGFAVAPSMQGSWLRRVLTGALLADASFVISSRQAGRFDISALAWAAPLQYVAWTLGTVAGVLGAGAIGDPERLGLDALFPVFYLSLLLPELARRGDGRLRDRVSLGRWWRRLPQVVAPRPLAVAVLATSVVLVLTPVAPPGVPVVGAAAAALIGLLPQRGPERRNGLGGGR